MKVALYEGMGKKHCWHIDQKEKRPWERSKLHEFKPQKEIPCTWSFTGIEDCHVSIKYLQTPTSGNITVSSTHTFTSAISVSFKPQKCILAILANLNRTYIYWIFMKNWEKWKNKQIIVEKTELWQFRMTVYQKQRQLFSAGP